MYTEMVITQIRGGLKKRVKTRSQLWFSLFLRSMVFAWFSKMVFLDNPATIFDRGQFSLQTSGSFDNKWFEGNGFVVTAMVYIMQPISVETTLSTVVIVEAVKHGIGQVLLGRNAKMAD